MWKFLGRAVPLIVFGFLTVAGSAIADESALWEIGKVDRDTREFALAPNRYQQYGGDPVFIVGQSQPEADWPYVLPGPADTWAGGKQHVAVILFGLNKRPNATAVLRIFLADSHDRSPPRLRLSLNGKTIGETDAPRGGPDDSITGDPKRGVASVLEFSLPPEAFQAGTNTLALENVKGSWILFDALSLEAPGAESGPVTDVMILRGVEQLPVLVEQDGRLDTVVRLHVVSGAEATSAAVRIDDAVVWQGEIAPGSSAFEIPVPAVDTPRSVALSLVVPPDSARPAASVEVALRPVRRWEVYLIPHSHVDIGYTHLQSDVEKAHWEYYEQAIAAARRTADYPPEARFKWNVEVLWATDSYLRQASPEKRAAFIDAVRRGDIGLQALYGNELTALCRPEELMRLVDCAVKLSSEYDLPIDTAMISDVPGYTWGLMSVFAEAGVKYMSIGPNGGHRIGYTLREWGDRAFYWKSPSGKHRVLCWVPRVGYWRGFRGTDELLRYLNDADAAGYPYDLVQLRFCLGDNAGPGVELSDLVRDWNARYAYPKLIIATASETMHALEDRYGDRIEKVSGDFTPYWEDGAASSALETGWNRDAAERLTQAAALWTFLGREPYPVEAFDTAWRNVLLYDEHTWGAHNSIREPDSDFAKGQWAVKREFAVQAKQQSESLLAHAAGGIRNTSQPVDTVAIFNSETWPRTDLIMLPPSLRRAGDRVLDEDGTPIPSQRLSDGSLAFLAEDIPPLAGKRYQLAEGNPPDSPVPSAAPRLYDDPLRTIELDDATGSLVSYIDKRAKRQLVDTERGYGLGAYIYVPGRDPTTAALADDGFAWKLVDTGPVVTIYEARGPAAGCREIVRRLLIPAGLDHVILEIVLDKIAVREKEGVHLAFPFAIDKPTVRMDLAWATIRPEVDQLPGACKNYFTVSRGVDIAGDRFGVTWFTRQAPLVQLGEIRTDVAAPFSPDVWLKTIAPSARLFSYVMNNYWETNYKADQEGPTPFVYAIRPHGTYVTSESKRFLIERSHPPIVVPMRNGDALPAGLLSHVEPDDVTIEVLRPTRDGAGLFVQMINHGDRQASVRLHFREGEPAVYRSNLAEEKGERLGSTFPLDSQEVISLRIEP
ncbi:glycoside hydrolase family 38 C-terminal domain-containing protein [Thermostilla marina]